MATLTVESTSRAGLNPTFNACDAGGDDFVNTGAEFIHVKNADVAGKTVTIATPVLIDGLAVADLVVSVPAAEERVIGPFPTRYYNDGQSKVNITYDAVTSLTVALMKLGS